MKIWRWLGRMLGRVRRMFVLGVAGLVVLLLLDVVLLEDDGEESRR